MKNPIFETANPISKLFFTIFIIFSSLLIFLFIGILVAIPIFGINLTGLDQYLNPEIASNIPFLKYFQGIQSVAMFVIPPFAVAFVCSSNTSEYLFLNRKPEGISSVLILVLMITVIPIINFTAVLNSKMELPHFLSGLELMMKP